jgi:hypothetical protein
MLKITSKINHNEIKTTNNKKKIFDYFKFKYNKEMYSSNINKYDYIKKKINNSDKKTYILNLEKIHYNIVNTNVKNINLTNKFKKPIKKYLNTANILTNEYPQIWINTDSIFKKKLKNNKYTKLIKNNNKNKYLLKNLYIKNNKNIKTNFYKNKFKANQNTNYNQYFEDYVFQKILLNSVKINNKNVKKYNIFENITNYYKYQNLNTIKYKIIEKISKLTKKHQYAVEINLFFKKVKKKLEFKQKLKIKNNYKKNNIYYNCNKIVIENYKNKKQLNNNNSNLEFNVYELLKKMQYIEKKSL